ncbi:MAG TPA: class I SAM-dependent methyltransferase [Brumimicrobium sp.]|nr:class I SAM-dependent methyltransferase [Brumimicrobium sp.]
MEEFWNERYSKNGFAYGQEPNVFFKEELAKLKPGRILLPGDGEGRNGVYAASLGWEVESFDISSEGKHKAEQLANKHGLQINYKLGALESLSYAPESFDVIALIFTHFNPEIRAEYNKEFVDLLKPGGVIISESFSKNHIQYNTEDPKVGGPKDVRFLNSLEETNEDFSDLEVIQLMQVEERFNEGGFHVGKGEVIHFVGRKKV